MTFELTEELTNDIVFSLEDQNSDWVIDAETCTLVPEGDDSEDREVLADEERFYSLPSWDSDNGYEVMEDFTNNLHALDVKSELRMALTGGRGVFRNFKNILKKYPEVERKWHLFKDKRIKDYIFDWYNCLRIDWGMEKLDRSYDSIEETEGLVHQDFDFTRFDPSLDGDDFVSGTQSVADELKEQFYGEVAEALQFLNNRISESILTENKKGFVCRSHSGDFAGCILYDFCPEYAKKTVVVTDFFVEKNFRGLGIGTELLSNCLHELKTLEIQYLIVAGAVTSHPMESLLEKMNFNRAGCVYIADLSKSMII